MRLHPLLLATVFVTAAPAAHAAFQEHVVIRGGRIIPVVGPEIEEGSILIENGKILAVGKDVETPYDAKVIDARGKVIFPGFVDAHFTRGMDRVNEAYPVTPFLSVVDSLDGSSIEFDDAVRDGVLTLHVIHGNAQPIAGRSLVVRPVGRIVENMTVVNDAAIKVSFIPRMFSSHVAQFAEMRRVFDDLRDHLTRLQDRREDAEDREKATKEEEEKKAEKEPKKLEKPEAKPATPKAVKEEEEIDRRKRALYDLTRGRIPAFLACNAAEVAFALDFAKKNGFYDRSVLVLGADAWKVADRIAASGRPVVLDVDLLHRERDPITNKEVETAVAPIFAKKGIKFALQTSRAAYTQRYLAMQAATAVRTGVDRETALKSITLWPAEMIGLGDRVGAIEKGRDANLLVLSGDPLSVTTFVEKAVLEGQLVYEREKDERLQRLLGPAAAASEKAAKSAAPAASSPAPEKPAGDGEKKDGEKKDGEK